MTVVIDAESRGVGKVVAWAFGAAMVAGILVGLVSTVAGTVESGMPRRSLAGGIALGVAAALAVAVAGLLVVLPLRQALAVSRRGDFDEVERILDRAWAEVRAGRAGLGPIARRLSPQAKGLLATGISCGATAGLWLGALAADSPGAWMLLVVLASVGAVVSFGCVVGTLFHLLVPGATLQQSAPGDASKGA